MAEITDKQRDFQENLTKLHDMNLENCLDLMQIYENQDPSYFLKHDMKVGAN